MHTINHNGMLTDARLDAMQRELNHTRALHTSLEARFGELVRAFQTTNHRVDALESEVFNRTFPNARHGGSALGRAERLANRLANRVAALERAAMTIPVGAVVNVVNPGGPLRLGQREPDLQPRLANPENHHPWGAPLVA